MVASLDVVADKVVDDRGADGETVAKCLRSGHNIGMALFGEERVCPEVARPTQTALNLVVDQDCADLRAALAESEEELRSRNVDTAFSLNGLNNDTACRVCNQIIDASNVVEGTITESRYHGREWGLILGVGGRAQTSHGAAMKRVVERHELVLVLGG